MGKKKKYYVVWKGKTPGIYDNWKTCKAMVSGYNNAQYKSFPTFELAQKAFNKPYQPSRSRTSASGFTDQQNAMLENVNFNSIAVDAASSGNPGRMEYRGVDTRTKTQLFHIGPFEQGTNNIGEFLALVHGIAFLHHHQSNRIIYSDSRTAISWVRRKKCNTKLRQSSRNAKLFQLIKRAEAWLKKTDYTTVVVKWETKLWGEIPADFGRK